MHRIEFICICLLVLAGMVGCGPKPATPPIASQSSGGIVEKLTIDDLTIRADSILVGEVTDITCSEENAGNIFTIVTFSVEQCIKGETEGKASIRVPGGEVDGRTLEVENAPNFQLGEKTVVFLNKYEGVFTIVGGFQGKFTFDNNNNMVGSSLSLTEFTNQIRNILETQ